MSASSLSRRCFLRATALAAGGVTAGCATRTARVPPSPVFSPSELAALPAGSAPPPVPTPYFPSRLHAFVWRNWQLVPPERMAATVGASRAEIVRLGAAMGLGQPPRITSDQRRRSYLTVIRRNWHLLPYEQLLILLDWTPEQLAFTLREDDFLFIKLGSLKPRCGPLRFTPSDEAARRREAEIARIVREEFPHGLSEPEDALFSFVPRLSARPAVPPAAPGTADRGLRFCYSYFALYGDPLLAPEADPYPDGYLARLAGTGVNGVWLQAVLHKLAPCPWDTRRSARYAERLAHLRALVARAGRHGVQVFLYLNEPRALPLDFFATHAELQGVVEGDHAALCTSVPAVRQFLTDSVATICRAVPDLGGLFTITASENLTHCWSHGNGRACPRCGQRAPAAVIAEVNAAIFDGIGRTIQGASHDAQPPVGDRPSPIVNRKSQPRLLVWDWGWNDAWAGDVITRLPAGVSLMSVSEWGLPIERGGVKSEVGEYSISAVGPGPRATRHWQLARERGLPVIAKIQAGNTWELSAVPYIPALTLVAEHARHLRAAHVDGLMLGWTLGGYPSPNLEAVGEVLAGGSLASVAQRRFGDALAPAVLAAWHQCSEAFREFPFHAGVVYSAPLQTGPANPLWAEPTGYHCSMVGFPYDDLDGWRAIYPAEVFIAQLEKVAAGFRAAATSLAGAARAAGNLPTETEANVMVAAALHWQSVANQSRFVLARRALAAANSSAQAARPVSELERLLRAELALARELHGLQCRDSRLGFEASNQYYYVPMDLAEKAINCRDLLERWVPEQRRRALARCGENAESASLS